MLVLCVAASIYAWRQMTQVDLPMPDLEGTDPSVAEAIRQAADEVKRSPKSGKTWGDFGIVLFVHDFHNEAQTAFLQAESYDDGEFRWPYLRGLALAQERPEEALKPLQQAVELSDSDPTICGTLGETYLAIGDSSRAEKLFEQLLKKHPDDPRACFGLAQLAFQRGETVESMQLLQKVANNPHCQKRAQQLISQVHRRQGNQQAADAAATLADSLREDRAWPDPYAASAFDQRVGMFYSINRAKELRAEGDSIKSRKVIEKAEQQHVELYWLLEGRLCLQRGDLEAAEKALRKAVELAPRFIEARFWLGQALLRAGKLKNAADTFRYVLELESSYGPAYLGLGQCLERQNLTAEALDRYRTAARYMPADANAHRELGRVLADQGQTNEAVVHLKQAVRLDPDDEQAAKLLNENQKR